MATVKVIPFAPSADTITQRELIEFALLRQQFQAKQAEYLAREQNLIERLKNGAAIADGLRKARLEPIYCRKVPWKTVAMRLARRLGYNHYAYVLNVTNNTKGTVTVSLHVE